MKPPVWSGLIAWLFLSLPAQSCGPFFPDTVLDHPQSALAVPFVSYLQGLYEIAGTTPPEEGAASLTDPNPFLQQIPLEMAELRGTWEAAGVPAAEIDARLQHYESVRTSLLQPIATAGEFDFPTHEALPLGLQERPLGNEFPIDVADYVEGARLHAIGKADEARTLWQGILNRPPAEKKLRAAWAAWMMAKTSANRAESTGWYERVETEIAAGATDVIGLRNAAKAWRAASMENRVEAMHYYFDAFKEGKVSLAADLRRIAEKLLTDGTPEMLATAAADPLVRRLVNLHLHAALDHDFATNADESDPEKLPFSQWLDALQQHATPPLEDGSRLAWALYASGSYDAAAKWLELSDKTSPLGLWLQAKFDLRGGKIDEANRHLSQAVEAMSAKRDWAPANFYDGFMWMDNYKEIQHVTEGRLLADSGIVALARKDYLQALESLRHGDYWEDAAYLAESVISTDGLIKHVRKVAPRWQAMPNQEDDKPIDPLTCLNSDIYWESGDISTDNNLRYLLARRLARENRLKEAREFMPPPLVPLLDHYIALDKARRSHRFKGEAHAAVVWREARIHRRWGAELFSTVGAPDGGARGWSFDATEFTPRTKYPQGWSFDWNRDPQIGAAEKLEDMAIPAIQSDEVKRVRRYAIRRTERWQYRYVAADLAWEAAKALPNNHPLLPQLYNTAGLWLANNDPASADRFYQAMVRRCSATPAGQVADIHRWFLHDLPRLGDLPKLPAEFKPAAPREATQ